MANPATDHIKKRIPREWGIRKYRVIAGLIDMAFTEGKLLQINRSFKYIKENYHANSQKGK